LLVPVMERKREDSQRLGTDVDQVAEHAPVLVGVHLPVRIAVSWRLMGVLEVPIGEQIPEAALREERQRAGY
jgi:hypothetical protein